MTSGKHKIRPATLEAIIEAATAIFSANPNASMSEVAIKAGVGRATLHRHFPTRNDLLREIGHRCVRETNAAAAALISEDQTSLEQLQNAFRAVIPLGDQYHFLNQAVGGDEALDAAYAAQLDWLKQLIRTLKADGHVDPELPEEWVLALIDQLIWTAWEQASRGLIRVQEAPRLALRTLLKGVQPD
ncbi:MAG: TetR/AcrR family transcriptional regulator [Pseudomonadota bacterium]